jgi:hypothetical protein
LSTFIVDPVSRAGSILVMVSKSIVPPARTSNICYEEIAAGLHAAAAFPDLHFLSASAVDFTFSRMYFVAQSTGRSPPSMSGKHLGQPFRLDAEWMSMLPVVALGVLGLSGDFWLRRDLASMVDVHMLFGFSLAVFVVLRFQARVSRLPDACSSGIRSVSRGLSRTVYLLLGLLVVFKQLTTSGTDDLRDYFGYALAALVLIRLMALARSRRSPPAQP